MHAGGVDEAFTQPERSSLQFILAFCLIKPSAAAFT